MTTIQTLGDLLAYLKAQTRGQLHERGTVGMQVVADPHVWRELLEAWASVHDLAEKSEADARLFKESLRRLVGQ